MIIVIIIGFAFRMTSRFSGKQEVPERLYGTVACLLTSAFEKVISPGLKAYLTVCIYKKKSAAHAARDIPLRGAIYGLRRAIYRYAARYTPHIREAC